MGVIGTFGTFTSARMGIYASQASLNVTGNNIANINTVGYCRQNMDLVSLRSGGSDRYSNPFSINVGYGVLCTGVSQSRDPYLDIRYRTENASVGAMGSKLAGLNELAKVLDEVGLGNDGEGVLEAQFNTIYEQMEILSRNVGSEEYDTLVRSSCDTLCQLFNTYAKELNTVKQNQESSLKQDVDTVNTILDNIRKLNEQIRSAGIYNDKALELRDQRNLFIDKLSAFVKIDVTYTTERIDEFSSVEKLVISLADSGKPAINLVDGIYAAQFEMPEQMVLLNGGPDAADKPYINATTGQPTAVKNDAVTNNFVEGADDNRYMLQLSALTDKHGRYMKDQNNQDITEPTQLSDTALYGSLQSTREILTEKGEFSSAVDLALDNDGNIKRGIPYYQKALDALAQKFAESMNKANTIDPHGNLTGFPGYETEMVELTAEQAAQLNMNEGDVIECYKLDSTCILLDNIAHRVKDVSKLTTFGGYDNAEALQQYQIQHLIDTQHGIPVDADLPGGNLFSTSGDNNDSEGITAANISVSNAWSVGTTRILCSKELDNNNKPLSTANENINHMISLMTTKMDYLATDTADNAATGKFFNGTFQEFYAGMTNMLAADTHTTTALYNNYDSTVLELDNDRSSVSGVDLNEEATNMMQYQKSYSAACRLLTTIDSMLDKLINGTAV